MNAPRCRGVITLLLLLLSWEALHSVATSAAEPSPFEADFKNPPAESRIIKIIHSWPDDPNQQDALIRSLSRQGFGGVVCNVSVAEYLRSEPRWNAFARAVAAAKKAGFSHWLYDEKGYPSATAGGLVLREHPEWEARGLLIADVEVENAAVTLDLPPGNPRLIAAFPVRNGRLSLNQRTNLSAFVSAGKLSWTPTAGRWRVLAITEDRLYEGTHASMSLAEHIPYPNLLDPEPTARFLQLTHDAYANHLGDNLGKTFVSTFTDEPSLMSLFLRRMPYRVLPWSTNLSAIFRTSRGYSIEDKLPALVADIGPETAHVRFDYWQTIGARVADNYFGQIQRWCQQHHVLSGGHLLMEENLANQVALYGDFFGCLRRLDAPSIDCLTSIPEQVPWFIARLAGSAADLEGNSVTMCETSDHSQRYRPAGDKRPREQVTPEQIRGTCNRLMVSGIDTITSYYSFDGLSDEQLRSLNEYIGRCCFTIKGGHQVAAIAVLYPTESAWVRFTPSHHYANDCPAVAQLETVFHDVSDSLFAAGLDFTYVDERALAQAIPDQGALVHGKLRWNVVVLPGADTLSEKAWENLDRFVSTGGVLVSVGSLPCNSETQFPSPAVQGLARRFFAVLDETAGAAPHITVNSSGGGAIFLPSGLAGLLPTAIDSALGRDFQAGKNSALKYTHRQINGNHVYLVINDSSQPWTGSVSLCAQGPGEMWDPATGQATSLNNASQLEVNLPGYGAKIFRFAEAHSPSRHPLPKDVLPDFTLRPLPSGKPVIGRGEFVRETLMDLKTAGAPTSSVRNPGESLPQWRVTGKITKGQVDTFLFMQMVSPESLQLQGSHSLVLDSWVPEGQKAPAQLLVILHQKNGADYIAHTGRLLNAPGHQRVWVPWTRFQLAGWSKDPNGRLDLNQIADLRIGWGGYLGSEGEQIEFSLAKPQSASLSPMK